MTALYEQMIYSIRETLTEQFAQIDVNDKQQLHDAIEQAAREIVRQMTRPINA